MIADESADEIVVPFIVIAPSTIFPVPEAEIVRSSFDLVPVMLLSLIVIAGKTIAPVPDASNTRSAFEEVAKILFPSIEIVDVIGDAAYNSVKLLLM